MKEKTLIGLITLCLFVVFGSSCSKDEINDKKLTTESLEGHYIAKTLHLYGIETFDQNKCWKEQEFTKEYSLAGRLNTTFEIEIIKSGIMKFHIKEYVGSSLSPVEKKYFFLLENDNPNNIKLEDRELRWHIEKENNSYILYQAGFDIGGFYSLEIHELKRL